MIDTLLQPADAQELAAILAEAQQPLSIQGGGTRGVRTQADHRLSTAALTGVSLYEPGALTLVAKVGTPVSEIDALLASEGQRLAFEPPDLQGLLGTTGTPTIGGVVATNASGPRRVSIGACRDFLLGVEFVDGAGRHIKNGGRVMKNVTGYDLVKLLAGSHGTLGVLTDVSLKVLPKSECTGVLLINGLSDAEAVQVMSKALGSPFEISGAAHTPSGLDGHPVTMLRIEGFEDSVKYRLDQLKLWLGPQEDWAVELSQERTSAGWHWVGSVAAFHGKPGDVWRVSVKPSQAVDLVKRLNTTAVQYDWGGGLVWLLTPKGEDVRAKMVGVDGHATLMRGEGFARFHPENAIVSRLSEGLRHRFDPRGILNPGLMG